LADAESWIFAEDFVQRLRYEVGSAWHGELPTSYLYSPGQPANEFAVELISRESIINAFLAHERRV